MFLNEDNEKKFKKFALKERQKHRETIKLPFHPIVDNIDGNNFSIINDLKELINFHFNNYKIPYIDLTNYNNSCCSDFRYGSRFKFMFQKNLKKFGNVKNVFFNVFFDDTRISKRKVKVVYLNILNDILVSFNKVIYTIC
jgi:hypothetical protein